MDIFLGFILYVYKKQYGYTSTGPAGLALADQLFAQLIHIHSINNTHRCTPPL